MSAQYRVLIPLSLIILVILSTIPCAYAQIEGGRPGEGTPAPEFSLDIPIITSIATITYLAIKKRASRRG